MPQEQVEQIIEKMYLAGKLDTPGMGFIYATQLDKAATFIPEEVITKLESQVETEKAKVA